MMQTTQSGVGDNDSVLKIRILYCTEHKYKMNKCSRVQYQVTGRYYVNKSKQALYTDVRSSISNDTHEITKQNEQTNNCEKKTHNKRENLDTKGSLKSLQRLNPHSHVSSLT